MRYEILRDAKGEILGTIQTPLPGEVPVTAEPEDGQELAELAAPSRYTTLAASELLDRLRSDVRVAAEKEGGE